jgi:hypothetical protein
MKPSQLTKRIEELSEKLKPVKSDGVRLDFNSLTEPEQLIILKNMELDEKYQGKWTHEAIMENKEVILKLNHIAVSRVIELFTFTMPRAMMLDEIEQWFFKFNFNEFFRRWFECQKNLKKWTKQDREDFLRDVQLEPKNEDKLKVNV